ncbi:DUF7882 family protein [Microbacterium oleivorans]|uniref:ATP-dependent DNA ligase n=1 Tax=Microbacterium oleivorans TaxID=273677 RepID=A0A031FZS8_9MICO|nr:hypothetical protein [Microbacterium oleivorans]AZS43789.1 hypothetical protein BWL13_01362 [Microbacterium oleivorans]EZP29706.1 ATP-dependent DNA ligase [Microbacterium oleivorans]THE09019.1 hypothetical protein E1I21_00840 [Microbacterium oleivorans]
MGLLSYNATTRFDIDDRTLAHLEAVIYAKLRRGESFLFTWSRAPGEGVGRTTVWMNRAARLAFRRRVDSRIAINPEWVARLMSLANSPAGLHELAESQDAEALR